MSDGPIWFAPKRYGYGSGMPIRWQGWALTIGYTVLVMGLAIILRNRPLQMFAVLIPLTAILLVISAKTTRGGWRWRWGDEN
jgi:hypothetical protein